LASAYGRETLPPCQAAYQAFVLPRCLRGAGLPSRIRRVQQCEQAALRPASASCSPRRCTSRVQGRCRACWREAGTWQYHSCICAGAELDVRGMSERPVQHKKLLSGTAAAGAGGGGFGAAVRRAQVRDVQPLMAGVPLVHGGCHRAKWSSCWGHCTALGRSTTQHVSS